MHRLIRVVPVLCVILTACSGSPSQQAAPPTSKPEAVPERSEKFQTVWETPAVYLPAQGRRVGHRGGTGQQRVYSLRNVKVTMRVRAAGPRPEEWIEWWQITCLKET